MSKQQKIKASLPQPVFRRILLKLSGEALMGRQNSGIDPNIVLRLANELITVQKGGVQIALVIGGGNLFRGISLEKSGISRITGDHMGMLATVMNALALKDVLCKKGALVHVLSSMEITGIVPAYHCQQAMDYLTSGSIVICSGGTGNPLFTTDTAACLRGIELEVNLILKATKVDGIYDKDPKNFPQAKRYDSLTYDIVLEKKLQVMDLTAICLLREHHIPLRVFDIEAPGTLQQLVYGREAGTLVHA